MKWVSTDIGESNVTRSTSARTLMFCADEVKPFKGAFVAPSCALKWEGARVVNDQRRFLHKGLVGGFSFEGFVTNI